MSAREYHNVSCDHFYAQYISMTTWEFNANHYKWNIVFLNHRCGYSMRPITNTASGILSFYTTDVDIPWDPYQTLQVKYCLFKPQMWLFHETYSKHCKWNIVFLYHSCGYSMGHITNTASEILTSYITAMGSLSYTASNQSKCSESSRVSSIANARVRPFYITHKKQVAWNNKCSIQGTYCAIVVTPSSR